MSDVQAETPLSALKTLVGALSVYRDSTFTRTARMKIVMVKAAGLHHQMLDVLLARRNELAGTDILDVLSSLVERELTCWEEFAEVSNDWANDADRLSKSLETAAEVSHGR